MDKEKIAKEKSARGNASQFFIAGQLCRMGYSAVVTLGNTPNTDILCSNVEGTKFVHIQVNSHKQWLETPGVNGRNHEDSSVRTVMLPPRKCFNGWDISEYEERWDLIVEKLGGSHQ
jgi:hypothetical protein